MDYLQDKAVQGLVGCQELTEQLVLQEAVQLVQPVQLEVLEQLD
jgi:hypothetical protein